MCGTSAWIRRAPKQTKRSNSSSVGGEPTYRAQAKRRASSRENNWIDLFSVYYVGQIWYCSAASLYGVWRIPLIGGADVR